MALDTLSTAELQRELERRRRGADRLLFRREKLLAELAEIDRELGELGSAPAAHKPASGRRAAPRAASAGPKRTRAKNDKSLPDAIADACEVGALITPAEAANLVLANGFKTTSARFNMMVSNALAKDKRFKRVGRGQYEKVS